MNHFARSLVHCGLAAAFTAAATLPLPAQSGGEVWGGDYFPNVELTNHRGEKVRFFDDLVKDKVVAINFIYTSCPDACPLETARLLEVQQILGDRVGKDVFMYSITIDPEVDTPEVLADYVERFQIAPGWDFLTGKEEDIVLLRRKLGLYIQEIQAEDSNDHNLNLMIGNQKTGRWMKRSPFENAHVLASQIGRWLHNYKEGPREDLDYSVAPKIRQITDGEQLFRTRCASCHAVGDPIVANMTVVGPNLLGVTERREKSWLVRWIAQPDKMLAGDDPIARSLFEQYKVPMPNLQLGRRDVEAVLEYIDTESRAFQARAIAKEVAAERTNSEKAADGSCCMNKDPFALSDEDFEPLINDLLAEADAVEQRELESQGHHVAGLPLVGGVLCGLLALTSVWMRRRQGGVDS